MKKTFRLILGSFLCRFLGIMDFEKKNMSTSTQDNDIILFITEGLSVKRKFRT